MTASAGPALLAPFRVRSFRFQWPSDLLTSCAFEMETLVLGWYILVETGSVLLLSLFGALLYVGTLVSPLFGVAGDRIGHRNLLCAMRGFYTVLAAALIVITFAGALSPLAAFCIAGLAGLVRPSDLGVRGALVADIVPAEHLMSAVGVSRTTSDVARIMGALAGAGLFAGFGIGPTYVVVVSLYALGLLLVLGVSPPTGTRATVAAPAETVATKALPARPSYWRDLIEGLVLVWSTPALLAGILLAVLVNVFAFPFCIQLLPYVAKEVYAVGETGLGFLVASFASGALVGSVAVTLRRGISPARTMMVSSLAWFLCLLVFAQMQTLWSGAVLLALAGLAQSFCMVTLAVVLLRIAGSRFGGRIMGVRMLAIYGLPVGVLAGGALIEAIGFRATATLYALAGIALTLAVHRRWRSELQRADVAAAGR